MNPPHTVPKATPPMRDPKAVSNSTRTMVRGRTSTISINLTGKANLCVRKVTFKNQYMPVYVRAWMRNYLHACPTSYHGTGVWKEANECSLGFARMYG